MNLSGMYKYGRLGRQTEIWSKNMEANMDGSPPEIMGLRPKLTRFFLALAELSEKSSFIKIVPYDEFAFWSNMRYVGSPTASV